MLHSQLCKFGRQKGKMGFSKQQRGIVGRLHGKLHPWFAGVLGFSARSPRQKYTKGRIVGKT